uniref:Uncharacterized protein n=1 Tax=Oncorhynchus kisutch TaxID=8019 RepID=A0A8C7D1A7_ONCKI
GVNKLRSRTFWMVPLRLRIISSTLWATSSVCLCRSTKTAGSMGGMSTGRRDDDPRPLLLMEPEQLGFELILIFCSRLRQMKWVRSPSWLTVPSSSRAEEMVALRPSGWPPRPPPRAPPMHAWLISSRLLLSCMPRTMRSRSGTFRTRTWAMTWGGQGLLPDDSPPLAGTELGLGAAAEGSSVS